MHCGKAVAKDMNAGEVPVNNVRTTLPLQEHEPLKNDHQGAHIEPLANEVGSQLEGWIGDNSIGPWQPELHEEVYGVRAIWTPIIDKILRDNEVPSITQNLDDGSWPTAWLQNTMGQRLAAQ